MHPSGCTFSTKPDASLISVTDNEKFAPGMSTDNAPLVTDLDGLDFGPRDIDHSPVHFVEILTAYIQHALRSTRCRVHVVRCALYGVRCRR